MDNFSFEPSYITNSIFITFCHVIFKSITMCENAVFSFLTPKTILGGLEFNGDRVLGRSGLFIIVHDCHGTRVTLNKDCATIDWSICMLYMAVLGF